MTQNFDRFKFRIWCPKQKRMLKNLTIWQNGDAENITIQGAGQLNSHNLGTQWSFSDYKPSILMQCTGLKDKNGKLIYEGDVLADEKGFYCNIIYCNGMFCFDDIANEDLFMPIVDFIADSVIAGQGLEIIGNIHENPELII